MNCCPGVRQFFGMCVGFVAAAGFFVAMSYLPSATAKDEESKLLRHVVLFKFKDSASEADVKKVVDAFRELPSKIPAVAEFEFGTNKQSRGAGDGLTHCFLITFKSEKDRETYFHILLTLLSFEVLKPHLDKAVVVDYWAGK